MSRLPFPAIDNGPARAVAARCRAARHGRLINLHRMLLHAPEVAAGWLELGTAVRYRSTLRDHIRELVICQVARRTGSAYEWAHHAPLGERAGVALAQLEALPDWTTAGFGEEEEAVLAYTDAVLDGRVDDALMARVRRWHDERQVIELTVTATTYLATARFLAALGIDDEGGSVS
jgi:alkylhydroperoxidase family enzyme